MYYDPIGKVVLRYGVRYVRRRYRREIRVGIGIAFVAVGVAAYLATREVREG